MHDATCINLLTVWFSHIFTALTDLVVFFSDLPVLQHLLQISIESIFEPHQVISLQLALPQTPLAGLQFQTKGEQGALNTNQLTLQLVKCHRLTAPLWRLERE